MAMPAVVPKKLKKVAVTAGKDFLEKLKLFMSFTQNGNVESVDDRKKRFTTFVLKSHPKKKEKSGSKSNTYLKQKIFMDTMSINTLTSQSIGNYNRGTTFQQ